MIINDVNRGITKHRLRKRIGRGLGSGQGKTAGRGYKGEGSRAGSKMYYPAFEGGQGPLSRRIPKRGFNNQFAPVVATVNVGQLNIWFEDGEEVTRESLKAKGCLKGIYEELKILGDGELTKKLKVTAHRFSKSAQEKIQGAGGEAIALPAKKPVPRNKMGSRRAALAKPS